MHLNTRILFLSICLLGSWVAYADDSLTFQCKRVEKNFTEEYEMRLIPPSKLRKAKVFLDDRDLDKADENGRQIVKSIVISYNQIFILIDARFEPETVNGVFYSAGSVSTQLTLNRTTGQLKKLDDIQGGILGANLGNGPRISEEVCVPVKTNLAQ